MTEYPELLLDAIDKKLLGIEMRRLVERDDRPAIFLMALHEWGNIGDLAINYNEVALLERLFPERHIFTITRSALAANWQRVRRAVRADDVIAIHGGGNLGDIWPHEELARQTIVRTFTDVPIISLPQTIHFGNEEQLVAAMSIYASHRQLLFAVRDDVSAEIALRYLPRDVVVRTEDMVCRQEFPFPFRPRKAHVRIVQRDDAEKSARGHIDAFRRHVEATGLPHQRTDTVLPRLPFSNTELAGKIVYDTIDAMHSSDVVVTDRLHGALFALIAGRPVVVFENSYGKIARVLSHHREVWGDRLIFADGMSMADIASAIEGIRHSPDSHLRPAEVFRADHDAFDTAISAFVTA